MSQKDLLSVARIAEAIYPAYPEDVAVPKERLSLYGQGCFYLGDDPQDHGYILSHPWHYGRPPKLNTLLSNIPQDPSTYYIHDLAMLPHVQGKGYAKDIVQKIMQHATAQSFKTISLVAVNNSNKFWEQQGFNAVHEERLLPLLKSYDEAARFMVREL